MALVLEDRVRETTTTTGTGTITLAGAVTGFQSFSVVGNGNTTYYTIAGQGTNEWEVGIGTYTASGTTLARNTVLASSAGAPTKTTFSAGTKDVFVTYPSEKALFLDASNNAAITGYTQNVFTIGTISTSVYYLDIATYNVYDLTLGNNVLMAFASEPAAGFTRPITLIVRQPATSPGKTLTLINGKYTDGVAPVLSTGANQVDVLTYWSIDGGVTYFGTFAMANVS
jgi:hypothetical protein